MDQQQMGQRFQELSIRLRESGFVTHSPNDDAIPVEWNDQALCQVSAKGGIRYYPDDIKGSEAEQALETVKDITKRTVEYMYAMEQAPALKAEGLGDGYKLLADFNGVVLAGHQTKYGTQFVTWAWNHDRSALYDGHYAAQHYDEAKRDFAIRAGLIQIGNLFFEDQLTEIYHCVQDVLDSDQPISIERNKAMDEICSKIESVVPDLLERLSWLKQQAQGQSQGPTMEYPQF